MSAINSLCASSLNAPATRLIEFELIIRGIFSVLRGTQPHPGQPQLQATQRR